MTAFSQRLVGGLLLLCTVQAAAGAELQGQVTDAVTGLPIEGASVAMDALPSDGTNEFSSLTDPFGFFQISSITTGSFQRTTSHPGYLSDISTNLFSTGDLQKARIPLTPALGGDGGGFDFFFQVGDVGSGVRLKGVPVAAVRYSNEVTSVVADIRRGITDTNGFAVLRGMPSGYYRFRVNNSADGTPIPKWLDYTTEGTADDKQHLLSPYAVNALLKASPLQSLTLSVSGYNPVSEAVGPLVETIVELEGLDPQDLSSVIVPTRTGLTDLGGDAEFNGLQAIPWRYRVKRMGYVTAEGTIMPDGSGDLMPNPETVTLALKPGTVEVLLEVPYADLSLAEGIPVGLQGLADTATEGINRMAMAAVDGPELVAAFPDLIPGRYFCFVKSPKASPPAPALDCFSGLSFSAFFTGETYVSQEGLPVTSNRMAVSVLPARVHLRLFSADDQGRTVNKAEGPGSDRPVYSLMQADGIQFVETETPSFMPPEGQTNTVSTGPSGEITFELLPGFYGVQIPGLTNYWGSTVDLYDRTLGINVGGGWPYHQDWPFGFARTLTEGCALPLDSGHVYELDLFVRKHQVDIAGDLIGALFDPTTFRVLANPATLDEVDLFYSDIARAGKLLLTDTGTGSIRTNTPVDTGQGMSGGTVATYRFENIPAGAYELSLDHPRSSIPTTPVSIADWNRGRDDALACAAPPSKPYVRISRIRLSS